MHIKSMTLAMSCVLLHLAMRLIICRPNKSLLLFYSEDEAFGIMEDVAEDMPVDEDVAEDMPVDEDVAEDMPADDGDSGDSEWGGNSPVRKKGRKGKASMDSRESRERVSSERGSDRSGRGRAGRGRSGRGRSGRGRSGRGRAGRGRSDRERAGRGGSIMENSDSEEEVANEGYDDISDEEVDVPSFTPHHEPGIHLNRPILWGNMSTEIEFFHLFFTHMIDSIVTNTNNYALNKVMQRGVQGIVGLMWTRMGFGGQPPRKR